MPRVSIIVPVYNRAHLITKCLNSVQSQSFRDYEIILVDDGSTDNLQKVLSGFTLRYCRQSRQGPAGARNKGLELATGEYIAFLDSDDTLTGDSLRKRVEILEKYPEAGWCYSRVYYVDENEKIVGLQRLPDRMPCFHSREEEIRSFLLQGNHINTSTVLIRRRCFADVGSFNDKLRAGSEDLDLWIRLLKKYDMAFVPGPLARYRFHSQNFCASRDLKEWEKSNTRILESIFNDPVFGPRFAVLRPTAYFHLYTSLSLRAKNRKDSMTSWHYLSKAWKVHPVGAEMNWVFFGIKVLLPKPLLTLGSKTKQLILNPARRIIQTVPEA